MSGMSSGVARRISTIALNQEQGEQVVVAPCEGAGLGGRSLIVDAHLHLNNYHADDQAPTETHLQRLRDQMDKWAVDQAIVLTSYTVNQDRPSAARLLELIHPDPRLFVVEGLGVTGPAPVDWENVEARLRAGRTIGLKFYPGYEPAYPTDPRFLPGIELAGRYKVPIMIHCGDTYAPRAKLKYAQPIHVDDLAVDYPDVQFIICHLGNPWFRETAEIIYKNENVHADIAGLVLEEFTAPMEAFMKEELREVILYSGDPESLLFGTDWPLVRMGPYIRFVEQLGLEPEHRAKLLGENARRLFRLGARAAGD